MAFDKLISRIGQVVTVVCRGRSLIFEDRSSHSPIVLSDEYPAAPEEFPPAGVPEDVRQAILTLRHEPHDPETEHCFRAGRIENFDKAERVVRAGIKQCVTGWGKPTVVVACRGDSMPQKRAIIDLFERGGARRIFLTEYALTCGIGLDITVLGGPVTATLAIEHDWLEFGTFRYGATLTRAFASLGTLSLLDDLIWWLRDDLQFQVDPLALYDRFRRQGLNLQGQLPGRNIGNKPVEQDAELAEGQAAAAMDGCIEHMARAVRRALDELTNEQLDSLRVQGLQLCGEGAAFPGLAGALSARIGMSVQALNPEIHPAVKGLRTYRDHLGEWKV